MRRLADIAVLTGRNLAHIRREPLQLSDVTIQPVLFTLLFVYVFSAGVALPGGGSYAAFAIAGLLALNLTTSSMGTAIGLSTDLNGGVIERFRTLPMWRPAVLVGRSLARPPHRDHLCRHRRLHRPRDRLATRGQPRRDDRRLRDLSPVRLCTVLGVRLPRHRQQRTGICARVGLVILFPLAFVSNAMVPTERMPTILRVIADWNPVSAVTAAARELFHNPNPSATMNAWPMQHPIVTSLLWSLAMLAVFAPLATTLYRRRTTD
jgi:ABC-2 type transport system permease protein